MTKSNEMARERTDWAEDRTILANERTYAGWMRTGMASVALALGLRALFGPFEPTWLPKLVASIFIGTGIMIFYLAWRNCSGTQRDSRNMTRALNPPGVWAGSPQHLHLVQPRRASSCGFFSLRM